jgi:hypothetical protein
MGHPSNVANICALRHASVIRLQQAEIKKKVKKGNEKDLANGNGTPTYTRVHGNATRACQRCRITVS